MKQSYLAQAPITVRPALRTVMVLSLGMLLGPASRSSGDQPTGAPGAPDLSIGADVVLTEPSAVLLDGQRQVPSRGERIFKVQRLGNGYADVSTDDGTVRGWVDLDHVLPLEKGIEYFNAKIAANPKDAQAYQRGAGSGSRKKTGITPWPISTRRSAWLRLMPGHTIFGACTRPEGRVRQSHRRVYRGHPARFALRSRLSRSRPGLRCGTLSRQELSRQGL